MDIKNVYAGIMTADIGKASEWYTHFFGRKPDYHPMENLREWDFPGGGVLQLVLDKERAGSSSITFLTGDIGAIKKKLAENNIPLAQETSSEVAETATLYDPENNRITFAQNKQNRQ